MPGTVGRFMATTCTIPAGGAAVINVSGLSGEPFKNLCLTVKPTGKTCNYQVDVYWDSEVEESHIYPDPSDQSTICHMNFPNMIFPPNCGTNVIPNFVENGKFEIDHIGLGFTITNLSSTPQAFFVYVCFEEFDLHRNGKLPVTIGFDN